MRGAKRKIASDVSKADFWSCKPRIGPHDNLDERVTPLTNSLDGINHPEGALRIDYLLFIAADMIQAAILKFGLVLKTIRHCWAGQLAAEVGSATLAERKS